MSMKFAGKAEISWNEKERLLYNALSQPESAVDYTWVREVYDDYVIVAVEADEAVIHYRASYSFDDEGVLTMAAREDWAEVSQEWTPKSFTTEVHIKSATEATLVVGGYGVVWGGKDLVGEHFTKDTDFWFDRITETPMVLYQHGQDDSVQKTVVGKVTNKEIDDVGLWVEAQIDLTDKYAARLPELMEKRSLGWSSGCAGYLAEIEDKEIKSWPIVEFSLTPTPAEPRTLGVEALRSLAVSAPAIKSLLPAEGAPASSEPEPEPAPTKSKEDNAMSLELTQEQLTQMTDEAAQKAVAAMLAQEPAAPAAPVFHGRRVTKTLGNFLIEVRQGNRKVLEQVYGSQYVKTDDAHDYGDVRVYEGFEDTKQLTGNVGTAGGYTIPEEFLAELTRYRDIINPFRQYARKQPMAHRTLLIPALDQTGTPAATNRTQMYGGVHMTWTEEAATKDETEPAFKQLELVARKLAGYLQAADELMDDSALGLAALFAELFGGAIGFSELWAFMRGTGAGQPLGVLTALHAAGLGPTIVVARAVANQIAWADVLGMEAVFFPQDDSKCFWLANATCKAQIMNIVDANGNLIWQPNAREGLPQTLLGRPLHWCYSQVTPPLGTQGDLCLIDGSQYIIGTKGGVAVQASEHFAFTDDLTTWRAVHRVAGQPIPSLAYVLDTAGNTVSPFVVLGDVAE